MTQRGRFLLVKPEPAVYGFARMRYLIFACLLAFTSVADADDCESVVEKSRPVLDAMTKEDGIRAFTAEEYDYAVVRCRRDAEPPLRSALACVRTAKDEAATRKCWENVTVSYGSDSYSAVIRVEGELHLDRLRKNLIAYSSSMGGAFPKARGELTPAGAPCCKRFGKACPETQWDEIAWTKDIDFSMWGPTLFQYSYVSDGKTVTATAVGDIECDGKLETYTLKMSIKGDAPVWKLTPPKSKKSAPKASHR